MATVNGSQLVDEVQIFDVGKPEWIEMKPIVDMVNEALKAAGKS